MKRDSLKAVAEAAAKRAAGAQRKRDVIDVRQPVEPVYAPTPEQMQHADYVEQDIVDRSGTVSIRKGKAFRRRARFETIEGLTVDQLRALRFYRDAFDDAQISATKSALDIRPRGGGAEGTMSRMEAIVAAGASLRRIEQQMPPALLPILRAVAGEDRDFKAVAIERFGGRPGSRVDASKRKPKVTTTIEPKSNRHRQIVRDEFLDAADRLVSIVAPMLATTYRVAPATPSTPEPPAAARPALPVEPAPEVDPAYLDDKGHMRPLSEIAGIIQGRMVE